MMQTSTVLYLSIIFRLVVGNNERCDRFIGQSCSGFCGKFFSLPCSCDEFCQVFNRCCQDYNTVCPMEALRSREKHSQLMTSEVECVPVANKRVPELVISSCPVNSTNEVQTQCQAGDKSTILPIVMSKTSRLHFKNIHCLICNNENETDVEYWQELLGTDDRKEVPRNSPDKLLQLFLNPKLYIPPIDSPVIACSNDIISTCPIDASLKGKQLCEKSSMSLVKHFPGSDIYKNIFCLACNFNRSSLIEMECGHVTVDHMNSKYKFRRFSYMLNWNAGMATIVPREMVQLTTEYQCWFDSANHDMQCKASKCVGTIPLINGKCTDDVPYIECVYFPFELQFPVKEGTTNRTIWADVKNIALNIKSVLLETRPCLNSSIIGNGKGTLIDVQINNSYVSAKIIIMHPMYNSCTKEISKIAIAEYQEYLESNKYRFRFVGEISTYRFLIKLKKSCSNEYPLWNPNLRFDINVTKQNVSDINVTKQSISDINITKQHSISTKLTVPPLTITVSILCLLIFAWL